MTAKGDATAGAVLVKLATLDGRARAYAAAFDLTTGARAWVVLAEGAEAEVDALIARQRGFDPRPLGDRDRGPAGRTLLDEDGCVRREWVTELSDGV